MLKTCSCGSQKLKDLTQGLGEERHYYCPDCKAHYYKGRWWTRYEWETWIEGGPVDCEVSIERGPVQ